MVFLSQRSMALRISTREPLVETSGLDPQLSGDLGLRQRTYLFTIGTCPFKQEQRIL